MYIFIQIILLIAGFFMLIKGADFFVEGASKIACKFHIPEIIIGLTIVAFGTSAPEAAISITAGIKGSTDLAISNVTGSNIMNIFLILGITALILPLPVKKNTFKFEIPFVIGISILLTVLGVIGNALTFVDGVIFWAVFAGFFVYLIKMAKSGQGDTEEVATLTEKDTTVKIVLMTIIGIAAIIIGSNLTVDSATAIAEKIGIDDRIIGLTIVAFGTSLPELITCITAARKGNTDIAIGNIVGSNIFNILFVLGTACLFSPIKFSMESNFIDAIIAILAAVVLFISVCNKKRKMGRIAGIIMIVLYAAYFVCIAVL